MILNYASRQALAWVCAMALSLGTASAQTSSVSKQKPSAEQNPPAKGQNRSAAPVKAQESRGGPSTEDPFIAIAPQLTSLLEKRGERGGWQLRISGY
jgi:hypothetical protein